MTASELREPTKLLCIWRKATHLTDPPARTAQVEKARVGQQPRSNTARTCFYSVTKQIETNPKSKPKNKPKTEI